MSAATEVLGNDSLFAETSLFDDLVIKGAERVTLERPPVDDWLRLLSGLIGINPYDPQAEAVYYAEHMAVGENPDEFCEWSEWASVEKFVRKVEASDWWQENVGGSDKPPLRIAPTARHQSNWDTACSHAAPDLWAIELHPAQWSRGVIIHEMAHIACDHKTDGKSVVGHGPKWVRKYLDGLYSLGLIGYANKLREQFVKLGVKSA